MMSIIDKNMVKNLNLNNPQNSHEMGLTYMIASYPLTCIILLTSHMVMSK